MDEEHIHAMIRSLNLAGYAVTVWSPEELQGVPVKYMEASSVLHGYTVINQFNTLQIQSDGDANDG